MTVRGLIVLAALTPACYGAETGDIARGAIQSQTSARLILDTSPCGSEASLMEFRAPWKLKDLGKKTCEKSGKTYQEYEIEQLAAENDRGDSGAKPGGNDKKNPDTKPDGSGKNTGANDKKSDGKAAGPGHKPATNNDKNDEGKPPAREKPDTPESQK